VIYVYIGLVQNESAPQSLTIANSIYTIAINRLDKPHTNPLSKSCISDIKAIEQPFRSPYINPSVEVSIVESAVTAIIYTEHLRIRVPKIGEMVRVEGKKGLFVVKRVDRQRKAADVIQRVWNHDEVALTVPFSQIRTVPPSESRAIQHFLCAKPNRPSRSPVSMRMIPPAQ